MINWFTRNGKVLTIDGKIRGCCCVDIRTFGLFRGQTTAHFDKTGAYSGMRIYFSWNQWGRWSGSWWLAGAAWFSGNELIADNGGSWSLWPNQVTSAGMVTVYAITHPTGSTVITNVTVVPNVVVMTLADSAFDSAPVDTVFWSADEPAGTYTSPNGQVCSYPAHTKLFKKTVGPMEPFV